MHSDLPAGTKPLDRIRVKDKATGHHDNIAARRYSPEAFELLKSPAVDKSGRDVPPQHHVSKGGSSATAAPTARASTGTTNQESQA